MKFSKKSWKNFINESNLPEPMQPEQDFSTYERDDMDTDHKMVMLLEEILTQIKILNHHMTPAKGLGASGVEKATTALTVAEEKEDRPYAKDLCFQLKQKLSAEKDKNKMKQIKAEMERKGCSQVG